VLHGSLIRRSDTGFDPRIGNDAVPARSGTDSSFEPWKNSSMLGKIVFGTDDVPFDDPNGLGERL
jgi:hypothetical protein